MRHLLAERGLTDEVEVDSAGTGAWHAGEKPDPRSTETAKGRGVTLGGQARQFRATDFDRFDYVLAMDRKNRSDLLAMASQAGHADKVRLFRSFDPEAPAEADVPDPYYGGSGGFDEVFDICDRACRGLIEHLGLEARP